MPELLALSAALVFGLVHFASGLLARRADSFAVALFGQVGGLVLVGGAALVVPAPEVTPGSLTWGAISGLGTGIGVAFLYRGLSTGTMSVVVPLSDVGAVALPVLMGVVVFSDRPSVLAWIGMLAAPPALWLVSRTGKSGRSSVTGTADGLVAGAGFALQFIAISRVGLDAGLWPILAGRLAAIAIIVPIALHHRARLRLPSRLLLPACAVGAAGSVAIYLYLAATHQQLFALATVLAALYPAIPVILALLFLRERLVGKQILGLVFSGTAVALIALG